MVQLQISIKEKNNLLLNTRYGIEVTGEYNFA